NATGTWGERTISECPTLYQGKSHNVVSLVRYALVCNGYNININSVVYDAELERITGVFAADMMIPKIPNIIDYGIIKALLSSNGDTNRSAIGCDTATRLTKEQISTIVSHGFRYVGRYISNTPGGTLDKKLSITEVKNILSAGLKLFPIFQESGNSINSFSYNIGQTNGERALQAAKQLRLPYRSTIYFAVDFDATDAQIDSNIIPYFAGVVLSGFKEKYDVGVYGTRNVCNRLYEQSNGDIKRFFVSDASYGFSGNLGYLIPNTWCFDQFKVDYAIGSGVGKVNIDKVAVSGKDSGISKLSISPRDNIINLFEAFDIAGKVPATMEFESDIIKIIEEFPNGDRISLKVEHGVTYNNDAIIKFNTEEEFSATLAKFRNNAILDNMDSDMKLNIMSSIEKLGISIELGCMEIGMVGISEQDNEGVMLVVSLTFPLVDVDGNESYAKASLMYKKKGKCYFNFGSLTEAQKNQAVYVGAVSIFGILLVCAAGPAILTGWGTAVGLASEVIGEGSVGVTTGLLNFFFIDE
ncbi:MAG: glycoside hydrolase domain-containing protein, partial [Coprobacillaceae bacterium]